MGNFITDNIDIWTSAIVSKKSVGRGSSKKKEAYGIKKLRELILELAVRGKLVPQDESDESATVLFEKIVKEREQLVKDKKIKKPKIFPSIQDDEKPFHLPKNWIWERIRNIGYDWGQEKPSASFTYIDVSAIDNVKGIIKSPNILNESNAPSRARKIVKVGTIIYSTVRPYLQNICVVDKKYEPQPIASTAFAILHPFQKMSGKFFTTYLKSPTFVRYVESVQTGIAYPAINDKQFFSAVIPLPPLNEQKRIVKKVDELMALCDKLEEGQERNSETHQILVETLLDTLTNVKTNDEFSKAWQDIAEPFEILFTTEKSIDKLEESILQLAVMGKIVAQDENDEPATVLLDRIVEEKERLIAEGKIKKQKPLPKISEDEKLFELPTGWEWCYLKDVVSLLGDGLHGTPIYNENGEYFFINGNNLNNGEILIKPETKRVDQEEYDKYKKKLGLTTVFVSINGTLGNVAFYNNEKIVLGKSACYFNLCENISKEFIKVLIESPYFINYAFKNATGSTIKNLGVKTMNSFPFAIPSLNEQKRIVKKVDELMALCDSLRLNLREMQTTEVNLADSVADMLVG